MVWKARNGLGTSHEFLYFLCISSFAFRFLGWKYGILIFVAIFFIILGAIGIGVSTYFYNEEMEDQVQGRFGIVFDAGGSGTRMYIYSYDNNNQYVQTFKEDCEGKMRL